MAFFSGSRCLALALLSGGLPWLGFPGGGEMPGVLVLALLPVLLVAQHAGSARTAFLAGLAAGIVHFALLLYWIVIVLGRYGGLNPAVSLLALSLLSLSAGSPAIAQGAPGWRKLGNGVMHHMMHRKTAAGPMAINVLEADPQQVTIKSLVARHPQGGFGRAKASAIAQAFGAVAAINGSFFSYKNNEPAGLLVLDGQIVSSSQLNRSVFGIRYDGSTFIDDARVKAAVLLDDGRELTIHRVNHASPRDQMTLYTPHFGRSSRTPIQVDRYEAAIDATGTVIEVSNGDLPIPPGGYVISSQGKSYPWLVELLQPGTRALVYTQLSGEWEGVRYAVGGGPTIVRHGKPHVTAAKERFGSHIASGRAPRTAIGYTREGYAVMVTVDGRQPKYSVGCTLNELARLMVELGAVEAINLDGGGSSTMVIHGKAVNKVSGGTERLVSNVIGIFSK